MWFLKMSLKINKNNHTMSSFLFSSSWFSITQRKKKKLLLFTFKGYLTSTVQCHLTWCCSCTQVCVLVEGILLQNTHETPRGKKHLKQTIVKTCRIEGNETKRKSLKPPPRTCWSVHLLYQLLENLSCTTETKTTVSTQPPGDPGLQGSVMLTVLKKLSTTVNWSAEEAKTALGKS